MDNIDLLVRVDADETVGLAHVVRTRKLIDTLHADINLTIFGKDHSLLKGYFPEAGFFGDQNTCYQNQNFDAVLCDCTIKGDIFWRQMIERDKLSLIVIDDYGGSVPADLIINGTVIEAYHQYSGLAECGKVLCGPEYALVDLCFRATKWNQSSTSNTLTIVIGSGERAKQWAYKLVQGPMCWELFDTINMIVGNAFPEIEVLKNVARSKKVVFQQGITARELAAQLSNSSVALITGGMILYEAMAVGVPTIVFPQETNLLKEAQWFEDAECVINLGYTGGMDIDVINSALCTLVSNKPLAKRLSNRGRLIIDGQGLKRVASAIDEILNKCRRNCS